MKPNDPHITSWLNHANKALFKTYKTHTVLTDVGHAIMQIHALGMNHCELCDQNSPTNGWNVATGIAWIKVGDKDVAHCVVTCTSCGNTRLLNVSVIMRRRKEHNTVLLMEAEPHTIASYEAFTKKHQAPIAGQSANANAGECAGRGDS